MARNGEVIRDLAKRQGQMEERIQVLIQALNEELDKASTVFDKAKMREESEKLLRK